MAPNLVSFSTTNISYRYVFYHSVIILLLHCTNQHNNNSTQRGNLFIRMCPIHQFLPSFTQPCFVPKVCSLLCRSAQCIDNSESWQLNAWRRENVIAGVQSATITSIIGVSFFINIIIFVTYQDPELAVLAYFVVSFFNFLFQYMDRNSSFDSFRIKVKCSR